MCKKGGGMPLIYIDVSLFLNFILKNLRQELSSRKLELEQ